MSHDNCHTHGECCDQQHGSHSCGGTGHHHQHCCEHEHGSFADELLELADEAWMEVLKEKIKKQIEQNSGEHLDALAKLVSDANSERWKQKLCQKGNHDHFKEEIHHFFTKGCDKG